MEFFLFWAIVGDALLQDVAQWMNLRGGVLVVVVWIVLLRYRLKPHGKARIFDQFAEAVIALALTLSVTVTVLILAVLFYYPSVVYWNLDSEAQRIESERIRLEQALTVEPGVEPLSRRE
jgi:hypothetical protein